MDLARFDTKTRAAEGVEIELTDLRTGKGAGVFLRMMGMDADEFDDVFVQRQRQMASLMEHSGGKELSRAQMVQLTVDLLAACTLGWRGLETAGVAFEFSAANARRLYTDYPAIREQVNTAVADRTNFLLA
jgi:hypothetical protein